MSPTACLADMDPDHLTRYWLGELEEERQSSLELHLFECAACTQVLEELAAIADGLKGAARRGIVPTVLTPAFLARLKSDGARIREYHLNPGDSVNCTIAPEDELAVAYVRAPLEGVERLDVAFEQVKEGLTYRLTDVPFDARAGQIVVAPRVADLRRLVTVTQRLQLVAVSDGDERILGEYTFNHAPHHTD